MELMNKIFFNITNKNLEFTSKFILPLIIIESLLFTISLLLILNTKYSKINKNLKILFLIKFLSGFIIISTPIWLISFYLGKITILHIYFNLLFFITYCFFSFYILSKSIKLKFTTKELETSEAYNKTLQTLYDNVRCFKHDFDNIVSTIGGYISTEDIKGLKKYYCELENDCQEVNNLNILNPNIINNPGVYNLLLTKYQNSLSFNIKINIEFLLDLNDLKMDIYQFTRILGILLDNAIEAACDSSEKIINLYFRNEINKKRQVVVIENSYSNKEIDINTIFEKNKTGKENHSGLGLYKVKKILNKNNNLNLYTSKDSLLFKQQLEIYYN